MDMMNLPLTIVTEEEEMFKDMVYQFAEEQIKPHSLEMDRLGVFKPELIEKFFELGLMGIEIPEEYGGTGSSFFMAILAMGWVRTAPPISPTAMGNSIIPLRSPFSLFSHVESDVYLPFMAA